MGNPTKPQNHKSPYFVCGGPISQACDECADLKDCRKKRTGELTWYSVLPHFIVDHLMTAVNPSAFKLFVYVNRRVGFSRDEPNYSKAYLTYEQINACTGISKNHLKKYIRELVDLGLMKHAQVKKKDSSGKVTTQNHFEITWRKYLDELGVRFDRRLVP